MSKRHSAPNGSFIEEIDKQSYRLRIIMISLAIFALIALCITFLSLLMLQNDNINKLRADLESERKKAAEAYEKGMTSQGDAISEHADKIENQLKEQETNLGQIASLLQQKLADLAQEKLSDELESLQTELEQARNQRDIAFDQLNNVRNLLATERNTTTAQDQRIKVLQSEQEGLQRSLTSTSAELQEANAQIADLTKNNTDNREIEQSRRSRLLQENATLQIQVNEMQHTISKLEGALAIANAQGNATYKKILGNASRILKVIKNLKRSNLTRSLLLAESIVSAAERSNETPPIEILQTLQEILGPQRILLSGGTQPAIDLSFSPRGEALSAAIATSVLVWDTKTGKSFGRSPAFDSNVFSLAYSADGEFFATAFIDGTVIVYPSDAGGSSVQRFRKPTLERRFEFDRSPSSYALSLSPDGKLLAISNLPDSGEITIWDVFTDKQATLIKPPGLFFITHLSFSGQGDQLFLANINGGIQSLETLNWKILKSYPANTSPIISFELDNESTVLATAGRDGLVNIIDPFNGSRLQQISVNPIRDIALAPSGRVLAITSSTGVEVLEPLSRKRILHIKNGERNREILRTALADETLAVALENGSIHLFYLRPRDILHLAKEKMDRSLTREECNLYLGVDPCPPNVSGRLERND